MELNRFRQLLESTMGNVKPLIKEFDYEKHKHPDINILQRVKITLNPGSNDVIQVEGLLGESKNQDMLYFRPLEKPVVFKSSNSTELKTDKEIPVFQSDEHTQTAVNLLRNNIDNWLELSSEGVRFYNEIKFGKNIDVYGKGLNFIGNFSCIFMNIKFERI
jgi:hypothetical protein